MRSDMFGRRRELMEAWINYLFNRVASRGVDLWRRVRAGDFPPRVRLGGRRLRAVGWRRNGCRSYREPTTRPRLLRSRAEGTHSAPRQAQRCYPNIPLLLRNPLVVPDHRLIRFGLAP